MPLSWLSSGSNEVTTHQASQGDTVDTRKETPRQRTANSESKLSKCDAKTKVQQATSKCDYPNCSESFRRKEHLNCHKQTSHGDGLNKFTYEFYNKDTFNHQDNLNNHRKLHARPNNKGLNCRVKFIDAAVPVIKYEQRTRKRRAPPKPRTEQRGSVPMTNEAQVKDHQEELP